MDRGTKMLLAQIVDRCDNTLCNLPSTHPKHRRYFELFKHLANLVSSIAGEEEVLWWKEYTSRDRANYDKVYYNTRKIREILSQLPENVREQILNDIRRLPGSDIIVGEYGKEELMRKIVEELSEGEGKLMEEEIFWEYTVERRGIGLRVSLYPRKEWGLKLGPWKVALNGNHYETRVREIILEGGHYKIRILDIEIQERLKKISKSFRNIYIYSDHITLTFNETPNIDEEIKKSILELNKMIIEEKETAEKIGKALEGLAVPKEER